MISRLLRLPYALVGALASALVPPAIHLRTYQALQNMANAASDRQGPERLAQAEETDETTPFDDGCPLCTHTDAEVAATVNDTDEMWAAWERYKRTNTAYKNQDWPW